MTLRARPFDLRLLLPRPGCGFRSRGAPLSALDDLRFAAGFFGLSSAIVTRSCGPRRSSANDAGSPNIGSQRPPLFFRPHAIRYARHPMRQRKPAGFKGALSEN
jgi:hypothetical protein